MTVELQERILNKLDAIEDKIGMVGSDLQAFKAEQRAICAASTRQRDEHHKALFGNGTPGLKTTVHDLANKVEQLSACPNSESCGNGILAHRKAIAYGAGSGALLTGAIEVIKTLVNHL